MVSEACSGVGKREEVLFGRTRKGRLGVGSEGGSAPPRKHHPLAPGGTDISCQRNHALQRLR